MTSSKDCIQTISICLTVGFPLLWDSAICTALLSVYFCFISFLYLDLSISYGLFTWIKNLFVLIQIRIKGEVGTVNMLEPSSNFFADRSKAMLLFWIHLLFMFQAGLCYAVLSVPCSLVIACWYLVDPLAHLFVVFSCVFSLSYMVSWFRYGTWLYRFLNLAFLLTFLRPKQNDIHNFHKTCRKSIEDANDKCSLWIQSGIPTWKFIINI